MTPRQTRRPAALPTGTSRQPSVERSAVLDFDDCGSAPRGAICPGGCEAPPPAAVTAGRSWRAASTSEVRRRAARALDNRAAVRHYDARSPETDITSTSPPRSSASSEPSCAPPPLCSARSNCSNKPGLSTPTLYQRHAGHDRSTEKQARRARGHPDDPTPGSRTRGAEPSGEQRLSRRRAGVSPWSLKVSGPRRPSVGSPRDHGTRTGVAPDRPSG
jgi:hypothetical protein